MCLFAHLIQNLSLALVNAASSSASLAAYVQAKHREGVLSHSPSHVGIHFRKDLAASSFAGPFLFDDDVLARIIASSHEDSHLDTQLSIAKAFKLPVFRGAGNADRKASSNQRSEASSSSSSGPRSRGGSNSEDKGAKRKAPPSPRKGRSSKAPKSSASPGRGKWNFRKYEPCPCPTVVGGCLSFHLGGQGCGTMGGGGVERGLRDSFSRCSPSLIHPHHPGFVLSPVHQGESSRGDSGSAARMRWSLRPLLRGITVACLW